MKRITAKAAAVLLSLCVAASALTVPVYAIPAVIPFLGKFLVEIGVSWILGESAHAILNSNESLNDTQRQQILSSVSDSVSSGALVEFYADDDQKTVFVQPVGGLSGEQAEMAQFIADSVRGDLGKSAGAGQTLGQHIYNSVTNNTTLPDSPGASAMSSNAYALLKTSANNAMNSYVAKEAYEAKTGQKVESLSELQEVLGDSLPMYNFSFTGPNPTLSYTSPEYTRVSAILKDGFVFTPAAAFTPGQTSFTSEQTEYIASYASRYVHSGGNFIRLNSERDPLYAFNYYFLTGDGNIYFSAYSSYNANGNIPGNSFPLNTVSFYDSSGKYISGSAAREIASRITSVGAVLNTGNQVPSAIPVNTEAPSESDFTTTAGGEAVSKDIPRSDIENIVGGAIGMGLIGADAPLTIGADGTITKADDIPIEKLGAILEAITSGNLNLDSIEEYLSLISTLVGNGNMTTEEQRKILENVNANTKAGARDLSAIRAAVEELTKEYEWEDEDEDTDKEISWITAEHTGFKEAQELTDEIEAVSQSKKLLNNLFNKFDTADNRAPSFSFYWDSDGDGTAEKYTILDLSFMEQRLTNANLEDKRRFRSGIMTVRSFVHFLIILVFYSKFAIKIIKRIPSLINGAGDFDGDIRTDSSKK